MCGLGRRAESLGGEGRFLDAADLILDGNKGDIRRRIAMDMQREQHAMNRLRTTKALHEARAGP